MSGASADGNGASASRHPFAVAASSRTRAADTPAGVHDGCSVGSGADDRRRFELRGGCHDVLYVVARDVQMRDES